MADVFLILFVVLFPVVLLYLKERIAFMAKWSTLIVCYIVGLLIGNIGILPQSATGLLDALSSVAVAISIPLLLFSVDIAQWKKLSGSAILAFVLAALSVSVVSGIAYAFFRTTSSESSKVAGMLVGLYTGGTPNLAAIKTALNVDQDVYLAVHTSDIVLSAVYLLVVMSIAKPILKHVLPLKNWDSDVVSSTSLNFTMGFSDYFKKGLWKKILAGFGLAAAIVGVSQGLSMLVPVEFQTMVTILLITSLALAASFVPTIRALPMTFATGEYFLYVFAVAVGAMGNIAQIFNNAGIYFIYVAIVLFGSLLLHAGLCALFKIDVDTMLIVSVSAICSPPFVGLAAVSLKARKLILPGITTGIIGYAVGNYLGIALAQILRALGG
ncbi:MAG: DUF819 family protein [Rectinema sp.]